MDVSLSGESGPARGRALVEELFFGRPCEASMIAIKKSRLLEQITGFTKYELSKPIRMRSCLKELPYEALSSHPSY